MIIKENVVKEGITPCGYCGKPADDLTSNPPKCNNCNSLSGASFAGCGTDNVVIEKLAQVNKPD